MSGKYVANFKEATHALAADMHMNADYPFKKPRITAVTEKTVTLLGGGRRESRECKIKVAHLGSEYCELEQKSAFEVMSGRKPTKFRFYPFKDEHADVSHEEK